VPGRCPENRDSPLRLGLDLGSTTAKAVVVSPAGEVLFSSYARHRADIAAATVSALQQARRQLGDVPVAAAVTGSAGMGLSERSGLPFVQEVVATAEYVRGRHPEVKTIIDIGGEDGKMILFRQGHPDIRMNGNCAGGTGAFIDQLAALLGCETEELDQLASQHRAVHAISSRCGVFAKTDVQNMLSRGIPLADIAMSVFRAVAVQTVNTLARGAKIESPVLFCGGPLHFFKNLRTAFTELLGFGPADLVLPEHPEFLPALGCTVCDVPRAEMLLGDLIERISAAQAAAGPSGKRLPPLFADADECRRWRSRIPHVRVPSLPLAEVPSPQVESFLGIDSGSTTTKILLLGEDGRVLFQHYASNRGNPLAAVAGGLERLSRELAACNKSACIRRTAVTGYGEGLLRAAFGIDEGIVETTAHVKAARSIDPGVSFILDIGGQDMKAAFVQGGRVTRLELNEACSSGCGSFLETFAASLGLPLAAFAEAALGSAAPCDLGSRCTVFMNSAVKQALREGATAGDISAGLAVSVVQNCLFKVLKIKDAAELGGAIFVQGGVFRNLAVLRALERLSGRAATVTDMPEMMGALGAALAAREACQAGARQSTFTGLAQAGAARAAPAREVRCGGCGNRCAVSLLGFGEGRHFATGNKCEKHFSNQGAAASRSFDFHEFKLRLLFDRPYDHARPPRLRIGIPRVLNMFDEYPFWHRLLTDCGLETVLSAPSSAKILERGLGTVMSDNICLPAKLVHGHVLDLVAKKVDRIFLPMVLHEPRSLKTSSNSLNCPIVTAYADVVAAAIDPERLGVPLDAPAVSFGDEALLRRACWSYLKSLGVSRGQFRAAFRRALQARRDYTATVKARGRGIAEQAAAAGRMLFVLAGRPYHADRLLSQNIAQALSDLGVDFISEDAVPLDADTALAEVRTASQWEFENRIIAAALWAVNRADTYLIHVNSFGCGPDAFVVDELRRIVNERGRNYTLVRVDEIENMGSVRLRLRSICESLRAAGGPARAFLPSGRLPAALPAAFTRHGRRRKILLPHFDDVYSDLMPPLLAGIGYDVEILPPADRESVSLGLKYANNDVCYPATIVIGDMLKALRSGRYDPDATAVGMMQTFGQCRATNYLPLLEKALEAAGFHGVPVVSLSMMAGGRQPGLAIPWQRFAGIAWDAVLFADSLAELYHATAPREERRGSVRQIIRRYLRAAAGPAMRHDSRELAALLESAVRECNAIEQNSGRLPRIGVVGEVFLQHNAFANLGLIERLIEARIEPLVPGMAAFCMQYFVNRKANRDKHVERFGMLDLFNGAAEAWFERHAKRYARIMEGFRWHRPVPGIHDMASAASRVVSLMDQFGEGWLIPAEMSGYAETGVMDIVSLQPFGCIANHVVAKGIENRLRTLYPGLNMLFLDFDPGTSEVNILNRLHFLVCSARERTQQGLPRRMPLRQETPATAGEVLLPA
jgi:predicted CoA-substrate-specific enzyme activase